jgi:hypothetical protein
MNADEIEAFKKLVAIMGSQRNFMSDQLAQMEAAFVIFREQADQKLQAAERRIAELEQQLHDFAGEQLR